MPVSVKCSACGKGHKAPDKLAGRTVSCLGCGKPLVIPPIDLEAAAAALLEAEEPAARTPSRPEPEENEGPSAPLRRKPIVATLPPLTTNDPPLWLRHLHWLLA